MDQIQAFLSRELFAVNGFRFTVGVAVVVVVAILVFKKYRG